MVLEKVKEKFLDDVYETYEFRGDLVAVVNKDIFRVNSDRIMFDVAELLMIAVALLVVAALMEVFIIPSIF